MTNRRLRSLETRFLLYSLSGPLLTDNDKEIYEQYGMIERTDSGKRAPKRGLVLLDSDRTVENVLYRQWKALIAWKGLVQFLRGDTSWGEMTRVGLEK